MEVWYWPQLDKIVLVVSHVYSWEYIGDSPGLPFVSELPPEMLQGNYIGEF